MGRASQQHRWDGERVAERLHQHETHSGGSQRCSGRGRQGTGLERGSGEKWDCMSGLSGDYPPNRLSGLNKRCISSLGKISLPSPHLLQSQQQGRAGPLLPWWAVRDYSHTPSNPQLSGSAETGHFGDQEDPLPAGLGPGVGLCCWVGFYTLHSVWRKERSGHRG